MLSPASRAARIEFILSSIVCVVQSLGKYDGAVSRLQWKRVIPAAASLSNCGFVSSPNEPQSSMPPSFFIAAKASQSFEMSASDTLLPLVTSENLRTPLSLKYRACSRADSAET